MSNKSHKISPCNWKLITVFNNYYINLTKILKQSNNICNMGKLDFPKQLARWETSISVKTHLISPWKWKTLKVFEKNSYNWEKLLKHKNNPCYINKCEVRPTLSQVPKTADTERSSLAPVNQFQFSQ